jgi:mannose-1-phosphate guanylyltransferase
MINLILCGGSGTRLFPISRKRTPKQFYPLIEGKSLFEKTLDRNLQACTSAIVVTNQLQYELAHSQVSNPADAHFILEPVGRNTAPAIALACFALPAAQVLLVTPSDHLISNQPEYLDCLRRAKTLAEQGYLVTFGIQPHHPETGFGYIEADGENVRSFKEKPDAATAQMYLDAGNYYWNSGMFCFTVGSFLQELQLHSPEVYENAKIAYEKSQKNNPNAIDLHDMTAIPDISIDYGVMEKSNLVKVIPADIGWSDLGSFDALYNELPHDDSHNTQAEGFLNINSHNNLILSSKRLIAAIDIDDLIIIDTPDALLICKRGSSQKVKQVVDILKATGSTLTD